MHHPSPIGLILAGGKSSRMGSEKALLKYHGETQVSYLFKILSDLCTTVVTSCRPEQELPSDLNLLHDSVPGEGPMIGIMSAMRAFPQQAILAVAIDMPETGIKVLQQLLNKGSSEKLATCFINPETSRPEPLPVLLEANSHEFLSRHYNSGDYSLRNFLETHAAQRILPDIPENLRNLNTPAERMDYLKRSTTGEN